jgi:hydroxyacylglutathione hydrolase
LNIRDRNRFLDHMTSGQRRRPANMVAIVATNQGRRPLTRTLPEPRALDPHTVHRLLEEGHVLVDTRSSPAFGEGHVPGSLHAHLSSSEFEQRVGWVVPPGRPILLLTDADADAAKCVRNMAFIALDQAVAGHVSGGLPAWAAAGLPVESTPQIGVEILHERLRQGSIRVLDVREQSEWDEGHIEAALWVPYGDFTARDLDMPPDAEVAVICATGLRSSTAISLLLRRGRGRLTNVTGGMEAWREAGLPTVDGQGRACPI